MLQSRLQFEYRPDTTEDDVEEDVEIKCPVAALRMSGIYLLFLKVIHRRLTHEVRKYEAVALLNNN
jgi:hypothetical protein